MQLDRRGFVRAVGAETAARMMSAAGDEPGKSRAYGSGHFGEWIEDEFGLPAFLYTCDQIHDPKAVTAVSPGGLLAPNEHVLQVGNDRLIAIASNFGHVQVRQDEGAPKLLNAHAPARSQFGGGFGYLVDGTEVISTYYPGGTKDFERIFGMGYYRKRVTGTRHAIDQVTCAPFGDDPVLLSSVTITNPTAEPTDLRWIEYWGCQIYQFSFRAFIEMASGMGRPERLRLAFGDRFEHRVERMAGANGLLETKRFVGYDEKEAAAFDRIKAALATRPNPFLSKVSEDVPEASFDDLTPPATFLVSLDDSAQAFSANGPRFFGSGGAAKPDGVTAPLDGVLTSASALLLETRFRLQPGESRTLHFLYGYLPPRVDLVQLVRKYQSAAPSELKRTCQEWGRRGMRFSVASRPWVARESAWNHYYLRSSLTYDTFFDQHILSQGAIYQYFMGFQGAARDPLQHALPFVFSDPPIVKEILRYTLKEVRPDGSIPYGIVGFGMVMPTHSDNSSDIPLWLLWAVSEYVLATRDMAFLDEVVKTWPFRGPKAGKATVGELLDRCYHHLEEHVRTGEHGVMRMLNDDWNDALVMFFAQKAAAECVVQGESVLNSAMASWVYDYYASLIEAAGKDATAVKHVRVSAEHHRTAARGQWNGKWLRRAWLGPTLGWLGEKGLWLEPQPWAILGGVTSREQSRSLIQVIDEQLRRSSPIGAMQMNLSSDSLAPGTIEPGTSINGGIWPSLNASLIWALAQAEPAMAWDEWKKNSFAFHSEAYPDVWYNTWSGGDTLNSVLSKTPGQTVNSGFLRYTDFPVMNLHSHACPLYAAAKLMGVVFTPDGVKIAPFLPENEYRLDSPLIGVQKTSAGYEGWYAPSTPGEWVVDVSLPREESARVLKLEVNGARSRPMRKPDGAIEIRGKSAPGRPLRWSLKWS